MANLTPSQILAGQVSGEPKNKPIPVDKKVATLWDRVRIGIRERERFDNGRMDRNLDYYYGNFSKLPDLHGTERPASNYIFPAVELRTHLLVESMGRLNFLPRSPSISDKTTFYQALYEALRDDSDLNMERQKAIKNAGIMGVGPVHFFYDRIEQKIVSRSIDPRQFLISPGALDVRSASWVGHFSHIPLAVAVSRWPSIEKKIAPGTWDTVRNVDIEKERQNNIQGGPRVLVSSTTENVTSTFDANSPAEILLDQEDSLVTWAHMYVRVPDDQKPAGFRWVVQNVVNNVLVDESDSILDEPPYVAYRIYPDSTTFWSPSMVDFVADAQKSANLRLWYLLNWMDKVVRPSIIKDRKSGVTIEFDEENGLREINYDSIEGSQAPKMDRPADPPRALFEILRLEKELVNDALGNQDILQGRRPIGVQTGEAMKVLSENANARIRGEARNVAHSDIRGAWIMLKLALQTMQGEMFRLKDDLLMDEDAAGQLFQFQTSTEPFAQVQGDLRDLNKFDIKVDTSTLIPEDRTSRANTFLQLFQMQIIDKEDLLDALDIPNRKRIIEKLRAREEGQIALAQQQGLLPQEPQGQGGF